MNSSNLGNTDTSEINHAPISMRCT